MKANVAYYPGLERLSPRPQREAIRILTAVPICDGHDSAITTINLEFVRHGIEVIYLGYHRSARDIVRAAVQEGAHGIGISSYNGGHIEFFGEVLRGLRQEGAGDIGLFGGGGGTITPADTRIMKRLGVQEIFFAGTPLLEMVEFVKRTYGRPPKAEANNCGIHRIRGQKTKLWRNGSRLSDRELAKLLSAPQATARHSPFATRHPAPAVGIAGPGGAGKSTLIDELVLRFLQARPGGRLAILSHDPGAPGKGALLGDRATMVYAQDDRVFMRSLATRTRAGGISTATRNYLNVLKHAGFDLVLVETAGIGQEDLPFSRGLVDKRILVMSPDYGGGLQLQKTIMLTAADVVVVNKADRPAARTAQTEIRQHLSLNGSGVKLIATIAKRHRDPGVDQLFEEITA